MVLAVATKEKLEAFSNNLILEGIQFLEFREPDIGNEITSIAILPKQKDVKKLCSSLRLAGKVIDPNAEKTLKENLKKYKET